jgi:hypothetical protein
LLKSCDAAAEPADGFHCLGLPELLLEQSALLQFLGSFLIGPTLDADSY